MVELRQRCLSDQIDSLEVAAPAYNSSSLQAQMSTMSKGAKGEEMQGAEVTADLVSPLYDESLSAPSAQPNVTIQGSHKDMTNLFQFKSW